MPQASALQARSSSEQELKELKEKFEQFDTDGSGHLCFTEVQQMARCFQKPMTRKELREAMIRMDRDRSGYVDFAEFTAWFPSHAAQHVTSTDPVNMTTNPGTVEFQVWLATHGLNDYRRALLDDGYQSWKDMQDAEPFQVAESLYAMGLLPKEQAVILAQLASLTGNLEFSRPYLSYPQTQRNDGGWLPPERNEQTESARRRRRRKFGRRAVRSGKFGAKGQIPHFARPHLAAVLPEFTNAGAERVAQLWGVSAQSSASYIQDHKAQRHAHGFRKKRAAQLRERGAKSVAAGAASGGGYAEQQPARPLSLPQLDSRPWGGGEKGLTGAMHASGSKLEWQEWRSAGVAKQNDRGAWGHWLPDRNKRLVQLASMKRKDLRQICQDRGISHYKSMSSAEMVAAISDSLGLPVKEGPKKISDDEFLEQCKVDALPPIARRAHEVEKGLGGAARAGALTPRAMQMARTETEQKNQRFEPGSREEYEHQLQACRVSHAERRRANLAEIEPWICKKEAEAAAERERKVRPSNSPFFLEDTAWPITILSGTVVKRGVGRPPIPEPDAADRNPNAAATRSSPPAATESPPFLTNSKWKKDGTDQLEAKAAKLRRSRSFFDAEQAKMAEQAASRRFISVTARDGRKGAIAVDGSFMIQCFTKEEPVPNPIGSALGEIDNELRGDS